MKYTTGLVNRKEPLLIWVAVINPTLISAETPTPINTDSASSMCKMTPNTYIDTAFAIIPTNIDLPGLALAIISSVIPSAFCQILKKTFGLYQNIPSTKDHTMLITKANQFTDHIITTYFTICM